MFTFIRDIFKRKEKVKKIKCGIDNNGMPYIDLTDHDTALIIKEKLKAFEGIKLE